MFPDEKNQKKEKRHNGKNEIEEINASKVIRK
jgi:hypothetical protein